MPTYADTAVPVMMGLKLNIVFLISKAQMLFLPLMFSQNILLPTNGPHEFLA